MAEHAMALICKVHEQERRNISRTGALGEERESQQKGCGKGGWDACGTLRIGTRINLTQQDRLSISDFGFWISDCGLVSTSRLSNPQFAILNPQSSILNPQSP
jgi:hypothetical protein